MESLIDAVKLYLTPDVTKRLGSVAGETPENTQRAMDAIVPTLLAGAANLTRSPGGANQLFNLINKQTSEGNFLNNLVGQLGGRNAAQGLMSSGRDILKALFGDKQNSVIDTVAGVVGIKNSAISSLLSTAGPVVMAVLAKESSARGLGASGLAALLAGEKSLLAKMIPAGLGTALGWSDARREQRPAEPPRYEAPPAEYARREEPRTGWWLWPVAGLMVLGLFLYSLWQRPAAVTEPTLAKREGGPGTGVATQSAPAMPDTQRRAQETGQVSVEPSSRQEAPGLQTGNDRSAVDTDSSKTRANMASQEQLLAGPEDIRRAQEALKNQGQYPGPIDGIMGAKTREALREFQKTNGLDQTGILNEATRQKLGYDR